MSLAMLQCPFCGSPIPEAKLLELQKKIDDERRKEFEAKAAEIQKQAQIEADRKLKRDINLARQTATRELEHAIQKQRAGLDRERLQYKKKIKELERQVERKRANDLGDEAEIDLFETLRMEFRSDKLTRIGKGNAGADILQVWSAKM